MKRFGQKTDSKEKEVQSIVMCVDQPIDCQQEEEKRSQRQIQEGGGRVEGVATSPPPFGKFSNLSSYLCLSLFHTKSNIISYNISS